MTEADLLILKQIFVAQPETLEKGIDPLVALDVIYASCVVRGWFSIEQ